MGEGRTPGLCHPQGQGERPRRSSQASWGQHRAGRGWGGGAWRAAYLGVDVRVLLQAHGMAKRFATDVTGEGPGPAVGASDVHFEPVWGGEHLRGGQSVRPRRGGGAADGEPGLGSQGRPHPSTSVPRHRRA